MAGIEWIGNADIPWLLVGRSSVEHGVAAEIDEEMLVAGELDRLAETVGDPAFGDAAEIDGRLRISQSAPCFVVVAAAVAVVAAGLVG